MHAASRDESGYAKARLPVYGIFFPWHAFAAAVWAVAVGLQTTYVIGPNKLEVCVDGPNFTPCKCVMASWVMAIILLALHVGILIWAVDLVFRYRVSRFEEGGPAQPHDLVNLPDHDRADIPRAQHDLLNTIEHNT